MGFKWIDERKKRCLGRLEFSQTGNLNQNSYSIFLSHYFLSPLFFFFFFKNLFLSSYFISVCIFLKKTDLPFLVSGCFSPFSLIPLAHSLNLTKVQLNVSLKYEEMSEILFKQVILVLGVKDSYTPDCIYLQEPF